MTFLPALAGVAGAELFAAAVRPAGGRPAIERLVDEPVGALLALAGASSGALHLRAARTPAACPVAGVVAHDLRLGVRRGQPWVWQPYRGGVAALFGVAAHGEPQGELWLVGDDAMIPRLAASADLLVLACDVIGAAAALAARQPMLDGCRGMDAATGLVDRGDLLRRVAASMAGGPPVAVVAIAAGRPLEGRAARTFADGLADRLRAGDVASWLGGGLFGALLAGTGAGQALGAVERLRAELGRVAGAPVAMGLSELDPGDRDPEEVLWRAEAALADARASGGGVRLLRCPPRFRLRAAPGRAAPTGPLEP